ncbi:MAG: helix-turn-helix domain-containing protein [Archaeoglobaceae archaeon]
MDREKVLRALQSPTRQKILEILSEGGKQSAKDLGERLEVKNSTIRDHLEILENVNIVKPEEEYHPPTGRRGKQYSLNREACRTMELPLGKIRLVFELVEDKRDN